VERYRIVQAQRLRIYLTEDDHRPGEPPLAEKLLDFFHTHGLAGASIFRAVAGIGRSGKPHITSLLRLSQALPLVVEVVDDADRMRTILPQLVALLEGTHPFSLDPVTLFQPDTNTDV